MLCIRIYTKRYVLEPVACENVRLESFSGGQCSVLRLSVLIDYLRYQIEEGDKISVVKDNVNMFLGVIFGITRDNEGGGYVLSVTAYDQLRYLKNRDTYSYIGMRASEVLKMIALDYRLNLGEVYETSLIIPARLEDNVMLLDIINNALDLELLYSKTRYTLFDDYGAISLLPVDRMFSGVVLNHNNTGRISYKSSIDGLYNRVKVMRTDRKTRNSDTLPNREVVVKSDPESESRYGMLSTLKVVNTGDKECDLWGKAEEMLSLLNRKKQSLFVENTAGSVRVRGGSIVSLNLDDFGGRWRVLRCVHHLSENEHLMDLLLEKPMKDGIVV